MFKQASVVIAAMITAFVVLAPGARASSPADFMWGDCSDNSSTLHMYNNDGRQELFWVGANHQLWHAWELSPGGSWSSAASLGGYLTSCIGGQPNQDGRLEIFGRGSGADLVHIWQLGPNGNGGWASTWGSLGGVLSSDPSQGAIAWDRGSGEIEVRVFGVDNIYHYKWQQSPDCCWTPTWH